MIYTEDDFNRISEDGTDIEDIFGDGDEPADEYADDSAADEPVSKPVSKPEKEPEQKEKTVRVNEMENKMQKAAVTPLEQLAENTGETAKLSVDEIHSDIKHGVSSVNILFETEGKYQLLTEKKTEALIIKCSKEQAEALAADHILRTQTLTVGEKASLVSAVNTEVGRKLFKVDSVCELYGLSEEDLEKLEKIQSVLPPELLGVDMDFDTITAVSKLNKTQCTVLAETVQDLEIKTIMRSSVDNLAAISRPTERDVIRIFREEIKRPDDALIRQIVEDMMNKMKQK